MLDWTGIAYDATPTPPPKPKGSQFFVNGCMLGIVLGMFTGCGIIFVVARVLAAMP